MLDILLIIIGFILLVKGADFFFFFSSDIAKKFHIPEIIIGLTIVAIGTSMPELMVSFTSAREGHSDIAVGNVIGSNIANMFLILGICSVIKPLEFKRETRIIENPFTLILTIFLFFLCNNESGEKLITRNEGIILLGILIIYIIYNIVMAKKGEDFDLEDTGEQIKLEDEINIVRAIINIIIGIVGLKFGGDFVVNSCVSLAQKFGISEDVISLTIVAVRN